MPTSEYFIEGFLYLMVFAMAATSHAIYDYNHGMPHAPKHSSFYVPTLHGWRAVGILWVLGAHLLPSLQQAGLISEESALFRIFSEAEIGIEFFFALSGYLITQRLLLERNLHGKI